MTCSICAASFTDKILYRTNEQEYYQPGWMCLECIEQEQPEIRNKILQESRQILSRLHEF